MKKSKACIISGLLLIAAALCLIAYNIFENLHAGETSEKYLEAFTLSVPDASITHQGMSTSQGDASRSEEGSEYELADYILNPEMDLPVITVDNHDFVGVISIPALEIELPVCSEWNYDNLTVAPCHYSGTPYRNDFVICAHNYNRHFGNIKNLEYGDKVTFTDTDGNIFEYIVGSIETLQPEAVEEMTESDWDLTLFTCTIGGRTRVTVRCSRVCE